MNDISAAIRNRLDEMRVTSTGSMEGTYDAALRAVLDLCDQAPVNGDVGVMFGDEIEHALAVALGLPGDPRHAEPPTKHCSTYDPVTDNCTCMTTRGIQ